MIEIRNRPTSRRRAFGCALAVGALGVLVLAPAPARAHFVLQSPAAWHSQDSLGMPQKMGPCGDEGPGTPTGIVTAYRPGQTITVTVNETIFHPGHYRIALSTTNRSQLPAEPPVTVGTTSPCGSVPIENPAVFPVLADGVFTHTQPFNTPQSVQVTLPSNISCTKCTLQIIEFMSDHPLNNPGGCFYHHCADIAIEADGGGGTTGDASTGGGDSSVGGDDSGSSGGDDSGSAGDSALGGGDSGGLGAQPGSSSSGCGCSVPAGGNASIAGLAALFALASVLRRRRH